MSVYAEPMITNHPYCKSPISYSEWQPRKRREQSEVQICEIEETDYFPSKKTIPYLMFWV